MEQTKNEILAMPSIWFVEYKYKVFKKTNVANGHYLQQLLGVNRVTPQL